MRLDYDSAILADLLGHLLNRLLCGGAFGLLRAEVQPRHNLPRDLHWLQVPERIQFRLVVLVFRCRSNRAPLYLIAIFIGLTKRSPCDDYSPVSK